MGDQFDRRQRPDREADAPQTSNTTVGKRTLVETLGYTSDPQTGLADQRGPDLTPIKIEGKLGNVSITGSLKFDSKNNGIATIRSEGTTVKNKLELGSIDGAMKTSLEGTAGTIKAQLLNETYYLDKFPPPLDGLQPKVISKTLDTDGTLAGTKLFSVGFAIGGPLPESVLPEWARHHYTAVLEATAEVSIGPTDLATLRDMRGMVDRAAEAGQELRRLTDQVAGKRSVIEDLAKRCKDLEGLQKANPRAFTGALQRELATKTNQLRYWSSEMKLVERQLEVVTKVFTKLHETWLVALSRLSPLLTKVRGPLIEKLCARLLPLLGRLVGKLFPFLLIATTVIDLLYLAKFLYDLCAHRITYVGLGGDYEPDLFDWGETGKGKGTGDGTADTSRTEETEKDKAIERLEKLGGPRTRLAHALLHGALDAEKLEPRHYERLFAILERNEVTTADIDRIVASVELGTTPDAALDALEAYFAQRDGTRRTRTTNGDGRTTDDDGSGGGKRDRKRAVTGDGERDGERDGKRERDRNERPLLSARLDGGVTDERFSGGTTVPWTARGTLATLVVGHSPEGGAVTVHLEGATAVRDGVVEFRPRLPGIRRVTTTEKRWNPATRGYDIVQGELLLSIPAIMTKPLRGRRKMR